MTIAFCEYKKIAYICGMENTYKVLNTATNKFYDATIYVDRKHSLLMHIPSVGVLPFSKKTGKIYGKNIQHETYKLITIVGA